jgi:hypothetical protein
VELLCGTASLRSLSIAGHASPASPKNNDFAFALTHENLFYRFNEKVMSLKTQFQNILRRKRNLKSWRQV